MYVRMYGSDQHYMQSLCQELPFVTLCVYVCYPRCVIL